jgi:GTP-binding protein
MASPARRAAEAGVAASSRNRLRQQTVTFVGSAALPEQFPAGGLPEVAFLGRSNVGKSSLLNALVGHKGLARVSSQPGRTRLVNFFRVGDEMVLADLPGYGYAKVPEAMRRGWEKLVTSYLVGRGPLALCVFLVDARHPPTEGDETLRAYLDHQGLPYVLAATKADKIGRGEAARRRDGLARGIGRRARSVVAVSAVTGAGVDELWRTIRAACAPGR